jgi:hypothetical protein
VEILSCEFLIFGVFLGGRDWWGGRDGGKIRYATPTLTLQTKITANSDTFGLRISPKNAVYIK